jgi:glycerophosphoryl diester phosphodiesterase
MNPGTGAEQVTGSDLMIRTLAIAVFCLLSLLPRVDAMCDAAEPKSSESGAIEIIAHRGASHDAPENTLESIELGWKQQADAVELDIMLSKDGRIAVIHDKDTKRLAGVDRLVVEQTLKNCELSTWADGKTLAGKGPGFLCSAACWPLSRRGNGC